MSIRSHPGETTKVGPSTPSIYIGGWIILDPYTVYILLIYPVHMCIYIYIHTYVIIYTYICHNIYIYIYTTYLLALTWKLQNVWTCFFFSTEDEQPKSPRRDHQGWSQYPINLHRWLDHTGSIYCLYFTHISGSYVYIYIYVYIYMCIYIYNVYIIYIYIYIYVYMYIYIHNTSLPSIF